MEELQKNGKIYSGLLTAYLTEEKHQALLPISASGMKI